MCLHLVEKKYKREQSGVFWKFFERRDDGRLNFPCFNHTAIKLDSWLLAHEFDVESEAGLSYTSGFHGFKNKKDARKFWLASDDFGRRLYRCKFRGGHTLGAEFGNNNNRLIPIIVAREIMVLEEDPFE